MQGQLVAGHALFDDGVVDQSPGELGPLGSGQHPANRVAAEDVQDDVEVVVGPLLGSVQLGDVPRPDLVLSGGDELGLLVGGMGGLAPAFTDLVAVSYTHLTLPTKRIV